MNLVYHNLRHQLIIFVWCAKNALQLQIILNAWQFICSNKFCFHPCVNYICRFFSSCFLYSFFFISKGIEFSIRWWEDNISTDIIKQYKKEIGMVMVMMMKWDVCSLLLLLQLWTTLKIALAYILHTYKPENVCANVILEHYKNM